MNVDLLEDYEQYNFILHFYLQLLFRCNIGCFSLSIYALIVKAHLKC